MPSSNLNIRVDQTLKKTAQNTLHKLGLSTTSAITIFLKQIVLNKAIPFPISMPNKKTLKAMQETEKMITDKKSGKKIRSFASAKDLFKDLGI
jgi:DNA-damage-inducible protein J